MARRRRSKIPRKRSSRLLMATQVLLLVGILVVILFFRDFIADGAGQMLGSFGPSDVQVQKSSEGTDGHAPASDATAEPTTSGEDGAAPSGAPDAPSPANRAAD